jgi:cell division protein FtsL
MGRRMPAQYALWPLQSEAEDKMAGRTNLRNNSYDENINRRTFEPTGRYYGGASSYGSYTHGSAARKLEEELVEDIRSKRVVKKERKISTMFKVKVFAVILLIGACAAFTAFQYTQQIQINQEINNLNKQYELINNDNTIMQVKIDSSVSIETIRQKALESGMVKAPRSNIFYVDVPRINNAGTTFTEPPATTTANTPNNQAVSTTSNNKAVPEASSSTNSNPIIDFFAMIKDKVTSFF